MGWWAYLTYPPHPSWEWVVLITWHPQLGMSCAHNLFPNRLFPNNQAARKRLSAAMKRLSQSYHFSRNRGWDGELIIYLTNGLLVSTGRLDSVSNPLAFFRGLYTVRYIVAFWQYLRACMRLWFLLPLDPFSIMSPSLYGKAEEYFPNIMKP